MSNASQRAEVPDHVRADQVFEYDYFEDPRCGAHGEDVQRGIHSLHEDAPDIFYSPLNGGYWVVTRLDHQSKILPDTEHFSNKELDIPPSNSGNVMIPLNLDPPEHLPFRMVLMRNFDQKTIRAMEPQLRKWANKLIDKVIDEGSCEFAEQVGAAYPVSIFMELMGFPLERFEEFRSIVHEFFSGVDIPRRIEIQNTIIGIVSEYFDMRRREPRDDLMSKLVQEEVHGRKLTDDELNSIGFLLFLAGLDTVANTLTFTYNHLAQHPQIQKRLAEDPASIADFVEEALRRFSIVQQPRICIKDYEFEGVQFRAGDMVACPLALAGMDERKNENPEKFDIDRENRSHLAFSVGAHTCVGNYLARMEMRIFTEEWIKRIPSFQRVQSKPPKWRTGGVMALSDVHIEWPARS